MGSAATNLYIRTAHYQFLRTPTLRPEFSKAQCIIAFCEASPGLIPNQVAMIEVWRCPS